MELFKVRNRELTKRALHTLSLEKTGTPSILRLNEYYGFPSNMLFDVYRKAIMSERRVNYLIEKGISIDELGISRK